MYEGNELGVGCVGLGSFAEAKGVVKPDGGPVELSAVATATGDVGGGGSLWWWEW